MKLTLFFSVSLLMLAVFIACKTGSKAPSAPTGDNSMTSLDWPGTYYAQMPCADCEGIETTLTLNKDNTYRLTRNYQGKAGAQPDIATGTFKWNKDGSKVTLSNQSPSDFQVGENQLFALDMSGNRISGNLADKYVLKKLDMGITEKYWKLTEIMGKPVVKTDGMPKEPHMILKAADFRVSATGGCNQMNGGFTLMPMNRIHFTQMISTMMACPNMEVESQLAEVLSTADSYILQGDNLQLVKGRMAPLAKFQAVNMK
jgi:copper homeostasis protein (lipoprotein)